MDPLAMFLASKDGRGIRAIGFSAGCAWPWRTFRYSLYKTMEYIWYMQFWYDIFGSMDWTFLSSSSGIICKWRYLHRIRSSEHVSRCIETFFSTVAFCQVVRVELDFSWNLSSRANCSAGVPRGVDHMLNNKSNKSKQSSIQLICPQQIPREASGLKHCFK